ncbi:hypothetical protein AB0K48_14395 [Nonomuraea sp. NPDC055795]
MKGRTAPRRTRAPRGPHVKVLCYPEVGDLRLTTAHLDVVSAPETRMVVHAPAGESSRAGLEHPSAYCALPTHPHNGDRARP